MTPRWSLGPSQTDISTRAMSVMKLELKALFFMHCNTIQGNTFFAAHHPSNNFKRNTTNTAMHHKLATK